MGHDLGVDHNEDKSSPMGSVPFVTSLKSAILILLIKGGEDVKVLSFFVYEAYVLVLVSDSVISLRKFKIE
jgi:hypothetical protein